MDIPRRSLLGSGLTLALSGSVVPPVQGGVQELTPALAQDVGTFIFATVREASGADYPASARAVWVHGYHEAGDGGSSLYRPTSNFPDHGAAFTSRDGKVWTLMAGGGVRPEQFGARGDVVVAPDGFLISDAGTDDQAAFDRACAYLKAQPTPGGVLMLGSKAYRVSRGVRLDRHISLTGHPGVSRLFKSGADTRRIVPAGAAVQGLGSAVYEGVSLPADINAVLILDGDGGRWIGRVEGVVLQGAMDGGGGWEGQLVDFGVVSTGSISDSVLRQMTINTVRHAVVLPDAFTLEMGVNRANHCLSGFGINKGTSIKYFSNYASNCRDYGHNIRDVMYSEIYSNAVDNLNDPKFYKSRKRKCRAYVFSALDSVRISNNGQEHTFGTSFFIDVSNDCTISNNLVIGLGSDYSGNEHIAVWEMSGYEYNTAITDNGVFSYKPEGLLQSGANPANHHFVYCPRDVTSDPPRTGFRFERNAVREERFSRDFGSGWKNNVAVGWNPDV